MKKAEGDYLADLIRVLGPLVFEMPPLTLSQALVWAYVAQQGGEGATAKMVADAFDMPLKTVVHTLARLSRGRSDSTAGTRFQGGLSLLFSDKHGRERVYQAHERTDQKLARLIEETRPPVIQRPTPPPDDQRLH